ncbi:MAG: hypothetical protein ACREIT_12030, partial [Tepidisphaeraceae bacterium]
EARHACPSCGLTFHEDCWHENRGCSAYGCSQVNALAATNEVNEATAGLPLDDESAERNSAAKWGPGLVAASAAGLLVSSLTFGVPSLFVGLAAGFAARRKRGVVGRGALLVSVLLCVFGVGVGFTVSWYWWLDGRVWGAGQ